MNTAYVESFSTPLEENSEWDSINKVPMVVMEDVQL
jgi:hypothetical protein